MRLYEAMACGAVPLVEAGNQEVPMLFQPDRHYFSYEPDRLEARLDALLADPARIASVAGEARLAVAAHSKARQIRRLLDFAGSDSPLRVGMDRPEASDAVTAPEVRDPAAEKALVKMRVLGSDYTLAEALSELQSRGAALPGLTDETLPASLLTLLEDNPREALGAAEAMLERMLGGPGLPGSLRAFFRMRLHALRGRWPEALEASRLCLRALDDLETGGEAPDRYAHFYPPIGLGRGVTTDLAAAYREDLETGSHQGYLRLMRAQCLAWRARALLALDRPLQALECAEGIPGDRFASLDPYQLQYECCLRPGDGVRLRRVLRAWFALDTTVWDKMAEGLDRLGDGPAWIAFMEEILILSRHFLTPSQVETLRALLESRRT
jgi:hypothetical protein